MKKERNVIKIPVYVIVAIIALICTIMTYVVGKELITNAGKYKKVESLVTEDGRFKYEVLEDNTIEIVEYVGNDSELVIPETIDGKKVTSIGYNTFGYDENFSKIEIHEYITNIEDSVFAFTMQLKEINVAEENTKYSSENGILFNKEKTEIIRYPAQKADAQYIIPDGIITIADYAFDSCEYLTNIEIPKSVVTIKENAFSDANFTNVVIPEGVETIGDEAFLGCFNLTKVEISSTVINIGEEGGLGVFEFCTNLEEIKVSSNNKKYTSENGILFNKEKTEIVCYPAGKKETKYTIPESVITIKNSAFFSCDNLKSIEIPESVTTIENSAFAYNEGLESIEIPSKVIEIDFGIFSNCTGLKNIKISGKVTSIGAYAFSDCTGLEELEIPESVTDIGNNAFDGAIINKNVQDLTEIELPDIIKRAMDSNDLLYSNEGFQFNNCSLSEDKTKLLINEEVTNGEDISLYVNSGKLEGLSFRVVQAGTTPDSLKVTSEVYEISEGYISGAKPKTSKISGTTAKVFKENIETNATEINIYTGEELISDGELVATGMKIEFKLGTEIKTYEIVVNGDLTGDGEMNDIDLLRMARYIAELDKNLNGTYFEAAEIHKDGNIADDIDLLKMVRILTGLDTF